MFEEPGLNTYGAINADARDQQNLSLLVIAQFTSSLICKTVSVGTVDLIGPICGEPS